MNTRRAVSILTLISLLFLTMSCVAASENLTDGGELENPHQNTFTDLNDKINDSCEMICLDKNYTYNQNHDSDFKEGISISKSLIIDGQGHTLNGNHLSRIFNITADNVVLKNINFINGNALGSYSDIYGGGAIYWNGDNGYLKNCTFLSNSAIGIEDDPYEQEQIVHDENGISWVEYKPRPDGATTNRGGAITWIGEKGTVEGCSFKNNHVDYPNRGGAIFWEGNSGKIFDSDFINNSAYAGSALFWYGANGTVSKSYFLNGGICDSGIFWHGKNGKVKNSILLKKGHNEVISPYSNPVTADYNFWGDTIENHSAAEKTSDLNNWILIDVSSDSEFVFEGDEFTVRYDLTSLLVGNSSVYRYEGLLNKTGSIKYIANKTGFVKVSFKSNSIVVEIEDTNLSDDFIELAQKIRDTPEGGILVLDKNYTYIAGSNRGILISKAITIDGAGFTLNGNRSSRIFNVTADNVVLKNINFINGNAFGRYYTTYIGGGAIYWSGNDGYLENCNFTDNHGSGIEDDPFDEERITVTEDGGFFITISSRPMGTRTNEGGAIVWNGTNGTVSNCIFTKNGVGYPNGGGAICWRGNDGKVINSQFYDNDAWAGAAIHWRADNGLILSSKFLNSGLRDSGIFWSGNNGTIKNSILLSKNDRYVINLYSGSLNADYNFWGDNISNPNHQEKIDGTKFWYVLPDGVIDVSDMGINDSFILFAGYSVKIVSDNLIKYYKSSNPFKVRVMDATGKAVTGQYVRFTLNQHKYNIKTDKNGYATLKINEKPGKYSISIQFKDKKANNIITVKTTLITKDLIKKAKKSAKFKIRVLNSKGKAYSKQKVKVKFKGKTYKLKSDKKGIATFNVPKTLKVGKYTVKTTYNGLTNVNKIIVRK